MPSFGEHPVHQEKSSSVNSGYTSLSAFFFSLHLMDPKEHLIRHWG